MTPMKTKLSFLLIPLVLACFALSPANVCAGTITLRSGSVFSEDPTSIQLSAPQELPDQPMIIIFDPPGAAPPGTFTHDINPAGAIVGLYFDAMLMGHGFLRAPDGTFTTFDAPGGGTNPYSINPTGAITGRYTDASNVRHGFLRVPNGTITTFDAPGAGTGPFQGTFPATEEGLNPAGALAGATVDGSNVFHGFVRAPNGTITTFDAPGAGTGSGQGTNPNGHTNDAGTITGYDIDNNNVRHGFLRSP